MKKLLLWIGVLSISIVTAFSFAGYKEAAAAPEKVTLRYMTWEDGDWQKFSENFIEKYMEQNPNVTIQYEPTAGSEYMTKLKISLSAGTAPDVAWVDGWVELFPKGAFEPLDDYIEKFNFDIAAQNPELLKMATYNDELYGLFGWAGVTAIYYNKKLFDEAGLDYPQYGWTWDDCKDIAKKLTRGEGADKVYGINLPLDWNGAYETIMWGNGARLIDDNINYDGVMNSDKMVEAVEWYTSFVKEGLAPQPTSLQSMGGAEEMFKAGKIAMIYSFSGFIQSIKVHGGFDLNDLGVVILPVGEEGGKPAVNVNFTNPICISKDSKNKDEAFKFLAARVGEETQKGFTSLGWTVPTTIELVNELNLLDDPLLKTFVDPLVNFDKYVYPKPSWCYSPVSTAIMENMTNAINAIVVSDKDPKEALDEAVVNVKNVEAK
jgi:multiple sugar transport system substrate-binding protein